MATRRWELLASSVLLLGLAGCGQSTGDQPELTGATRVSIVLDGAEQGRGSSSVSTCPPLLTTAQTADIRAHFGDSMPVQIPDTAPDHISLEVSLAAFRGPGVYPLRLSDRAGTASFVGGQRHSDGQQREVDFGAASGEITISPDGRRITIDVPVEYSRSNQFPFLPTKLGSGRLRALIECSAAPSGPPSTRP